MQKLQTYFLFLIFFLHLFSISCQHHDNPPAMSNPEANTPSSFSFQLLDPTIAQVQASVGKVESQAYGDRFQVPTFTMAFKGNDFVKILRCNSSYLTFLQSLLANIPASSINDDGGFVWSDSFGNTSMCKVVSTMTKSSFFQDIAAPNGNFFYVINPCVSKELSATQKEQCSNILTLTNTMEYSTSLTAAFLAKAAELNQAENTYDTIIGKLNGLTERLGQQRDACMLNAQAGQMAQQAHNLWGEVISISAAAAAGVGAGITSRLYYQRQAAKIPVTPPGEIAPNIVTPGVETLPVKPGMSINVKSMIWGSVAFATVAGLGMLITHLTTPGVSPSAPCATAQNYAQDILDVQNSQALQSAQKNLISLSKQLTEMDKEFKGYDEAIFNTTSEP